MNIVEEEWPCPIVLHHPVSCYDLVQLVIHPLRQGFGQENRFYLHRIASYLVAIQQQNPNQDSRRTIITQKFTGRALPLQNIFVVQHLYLIHIITMY